jgi:hypothetical protein
VRALAKEIPESPLPLHPHPIAVAQSVETWLSILQNQSLSGASFTTVADLQEHIDAFISAHNQTATSFAWTKKKVGASKAAVSLSCDSEY